MIKSILGQILLIYGIWYINAQIQICYIKHKNND